jgi:homoserine dehydrogenase
MEEIQTAYYLKMRATDRPGVLADVTKILGDRGISIEAILQKEPHEEGEQATITMLTHVVMEGSMNQAITDIEALDTISGPITRIRLEHLKK